MKQEPPSQTFVHDGGSLSYSVFGDFSDKNITLSGVFVLKETRMPIEINKSGLK